MDHVSRFTQHTDQHSLAYADSCRRFFFILCSYPEAENTDPVMAGLLTYSPGNAFPFPTYPGTVAEVVPGCMEITAAGTVADLHGVPFSSGHKKICRKPQLRQI
jgi:hypothetical protein